MNLKTQAFESKLAQSRNSLNMWRQQHQIHNDDSSHRCYSRALLRHLTLLDVAVGTLNLTHNGRGEPEYLNEYDEMTNEWSDIDGNRN